MGYIKHSTKFLCTGFLYFTFKVRLLLSITLDNKDKAGYRNESNIYDVP